MKEIPQRELRNHVSAVLRAAEAGQEYTVTVDGRPVATLGPYRGRQWVAAQGVRDVLTTPTDSALLDDVAEHAPGADLAEDPWTGP